ncbi:MAG: hypothetical protein ACOCY7_05145 [Halodesulfurarchaeum sp.]
MFRPADGTVTENCEEGIPAVLEHFPPKECDLEDGKLRVTRAFRGQTLEAAIGYLTSLGGSRVDEATVVGDGWRATLSADRVPVGPTYRLTEVTITWEGREDAVEDVIVRFWLKSFRAPG